MLKRRRKTRLPRQKGLSLNKMIPNAITVSATCAGLTGVRFAIEGSYEFAAGAVLLAALLDGLDGRMARLLNATSDFGEILDSLSDFVAFGVSPALIMYYWLLQDMGGIGWAVALFFAVCCGLRLARFNSSLDKLPSYAYNYFQGVPAPAGAGLGLLPLLIGLGLGDLSQVPAIPAAIWMVCSALLMVSSLPTFSFKKFKIPPKMILPALALFALGVAAVIGRPWASLSVFLVGYVALIPFSMRRFAQLRDEAERLQREEEMKAEGVTPLHPPQDQTDIHKE